ncbi:MAG: DNA cytosine methyltransferase [Clostridia bacterium]
MVVIDLFAGAGGLTEGFLNEGYKFVAHVEKEYWACETLKTRIMFYYLKEKNDLETYNKYLKASDDYRKISENRKIVFKKYPELEEILEKTVLNKKFGDTKRDKDATDINEIFKMINDSMKYLGEKKIDLIIGGPPCQAYSVIGRSRMKEKVNEDERNYLFYYYRDIVKKYKPKMFIFENVPGIFTAQEGKIFDEISKEFEKIGYILKIGKKEKREENLQEAVNYGVYQTRKRVILFGVKKGLKYDYPDFTKYAEKFNEKISTKNAISDLNNLKDGKGEDRKLIKYNKPANSEYEEYLRRDSIGILNHKARKLNERDRKIYALAIEKSKKNEKMYYSELPKELKTHKNEKSFSDRFKVHGMDEVPHTIVAHISKDGHYNIHPDVKQCRALTVREAARIQSFPDNYLFEGPRTAQYIQVGNAVPPLLSIAIARALKKLE